MSDRPTCRRCGKRLAPVYGPDVETRRTEALPDPALGTTEVVTRRRGELLGYGYSATGLFCSLTCGHRWACVELQRRADS